MIVNVPGFEPLKLVSGVDSSCEGCFMDTQEWGVRKCHLVPCMLGETGNPGYEGIAVPADE